ncbi:hypothetical protein BH10ACT6_BH10ACT6_03330 [soil metagenome]
MTEPALVESGRRSRVAAVVRHPLTLWAAFVLVHFWLGMLGLFAPGLPLGDVILVYKFWVEHGLVAHHWVGLDTPGVYPVVALLPMIVAYLFGPALYASTWLSLVMLVDAAAFAVIMGFGRDRRLAPVAWWWLGLLVLLGPVALGRIDSIVAPVAIVGLLCLGAAPRLAGALLAVAAWIKVWPAALIAAVLIVIRGRWRFLTGVVVTCVVIVVGAMLLGGGTDLLSFVTQQTGRGLQIESGIGTFWMWGTYVNPNVFYLAYDTTILTYQLTGPGVDVAAAITTPLMALVVAGLLVLGLVATRRGVLIGHLLPPLALAITTALIVFNKVGSPQFVTWLAVPIVFGLATAATGRGISFRSPALLGLVIAALTQIVYPYLYSYLLDRNSTMIVVLTMRNFLYLVLLGWAIAAVVRLCRTGPERGLREGAVYEAEWLPQVWPFGAESRPSTGSPSESFDPDEVRGPR